jgi:hypothetical protein
MGEVVEGLGPSERQRIAALRRAGTFFWADASFAETSGDDLGGPWTFPAPYSAGSSTFARTPPSRKFHSDGERVVFDFSCFLELAELAPRTPGPLRPIEVHVLISGDYLLTVHEERVSLPGLLSPDLPEGRSEQYVVYSILDAMAKLIDLRLNETIYWLTVAATIFLPLTFVTGFFGMNFHWMIDRIDTSLAFVLLGIGGCVLGVALTALLVRRRGTPIEPDRSQSFG